MREVQGNLWDFGGIPAVTTNGYINKKGQAVMGRGCAKEATLRFPTIQYRLAFHLLMYDNHVFYLHEFGERGVITFPVKHKYNQNASLQLIERSAVELIDLIIPHFHIEDTIYLPRPGCGNGNLNWDDVKPIISNILTDQVCVVTF
jgi:hypothetical protein